jgi:hypothetical protein
VDLPVPSHSTALAGACQNQGCAGNLSEPVGASSACLASEEISGFQKEITMTINIAEN